MRATLALNGLIEGFQLRFQNHLDPGLGICRSQQLPAQS